MLPRWLLLICFCIFFQWDIDCSSAGKLDIVHEWKYIDYDFGCEDKRQEAIKSGEYDYKNAVPIDVDKWKNLTFVTVPRQKGVPSSLNIITDKKGPGGPLLKPYPDWSWAKLGDCNSITSVYRVAIDRFSRLWVLDNGKVGDDVVCQPQLLAFDLLDSSLVRRIKIPKEIAVNATTGTGLLVTPVVDTRGKTCRDVVVYIADVAGYAVIYYDDGTKSFKRLTSWAFDYDPRYTKFTIEGQSFTVEDGPVGLGLSPLTGNLYFTPMSSHTIGVISTDVLEKSSGNDLIVEAYEDLLYTQESVKVVSENGILFSGRIGDTSIGCWYERKPKTKQYVGEVAKDPVTLPFISGIKAIKETSEELWVLSNSYQKVATGTLNFHETNFRILKGNIEELVKGTVCEAPKPHVIPLPPLGHGPVIFCNN